MSADAKRLRQIRKSDPYQAAGAVCSRSGERSYFCGDPTGGMYVFMRAA